MAYDTPTAADTHWFGHRKIELMPGEAQLTLSYGLRVEWKSLDIPADDPGGVTARAALVDSLDCVEIETPKGTGWIRLVIDAAAMATDTLCGVRVLIRLTPRDGSSQTAGKQAVASGRFDGPRLDLIETGTTRITYEPGQWHEITGAFVQPAGPAAYGIVLNLPEDHVVTLALAEIGRQDVVLDAVARGPLDMQGAAFVTPFRARLLNPDSARQSATCPAVFAADAGITGYKLTGWAFADTASPGIQVAGRNGAGPVPAETGLRAEIAPGVTATCGFEAAVAPFITDGAPMTCHLRFENGGPPGPAFLTINADAGLQISGTEQRRPARATRPAVRLFFAPEEPADPYQRLLACAVDRATPLPGGMQGAVDRLLDPDRDGVPVVLHLTSLGGMLADQSGPGRATDRAHDLSRRLAVFARQGGQLIWTLRAPPEGPWTEAERILGQAIAALGGPVHIHSETLCQPLSETWGIEIDPARFVIVPHGGTVGQYPDYVPRSSARARLGLDDTAPLFLLFGRLGHGKGLDTAVAAFKRLRKTRPDAHLLIIGPTAPGAKKGHIRRRFGTLHHVRVIENQVANTTLQWYFRAADWALQPYPDDRTPAALMTAMSFGLPAIAPSRGMIPEILPDTAGLLYDPEAPDALDACLARAAGTPAETRREMGDRAREAMAARSWNVAARALETGLSNPAGRTVTLLFEDGPQQAMLLGKPLPDSATARTAIIILNYRDCDDTSRLIASLRAGTDTDFDIFIVDNGSPDVTRRELAQRFAECHILSLPRNLGYAVGNNAGLQLAEGLGYPYILILNPDLVAPPEALQGLVTAAEDRSDPAVFAPALLRGGGTGRVASAGCYLSTEAGLATGHMFAGEPEAHLPDAPYEADFVTGAAMFLSHETLRRIGPIPERYFLYFEESDWLTAAARKGVPSIVLPQIRMEHHKRSEKGDMPARHYFYYYIRNAQIFGHSLIAQDGPGPDPDETRARIVNDFIEPWLARITRAAPKERDAFRELADIALDDGAAGKTGAVDLVAMQLADPSLPPVDALTARGLRVRFYTGGGRSPKIAGTLDLPQGVEPSGPWVIGVVQGGTVIARAKITPPEDGLSEPLAVDFPLPRDNFESGQGHTVTLYLNGRKTGSVSAYIPPYVLECDGKLVDLNGYCCTGWLRNKAKLDTPLEVEIRCDGDVVGRGLADLPVNQGPCGFSIRLPRTLFDGTERLFEIAIAGQDAPVAEARMAQKTGQDKLLARPSAALDHALFLHHEIWTGADGPEAHPLTRDSGARVAAMAAEASGDDRRVSIVLPVMAESEIETAETAWRSALGQTHTDWELVVVSRGTELAARLAPRIEATADQRLRLLAPEQTPTSSAAARNAGIAATDAPVIAHLEPGAVWDPAFLSIMLAALRDETEAALCMEWLVQKVCSPEHAGEIDEVIGLRGGQPTLPRLENRPAGALAAFVSTRSAIALQGGFDPAQPTFEGWDLMLRMADSAQAPRAVQAPLVTVDVGPAPLRHDPKRRLAIERIGTLTDRLATRFGAETPVETLAERTTDLALLATAVEGSDAAVRIARRLKETIAILPDPATCRLLAVVPKALTATVRAALQEDGVPCDVIGVGHGKTGSNKMKRAAVDTLAHALVWRRKSADLIVMQPQTLLQGGALDAIGHAISTAPDAGIVVPRHGVDGRSDAAATHAPGAWPERDACVAISARRRNLDDPALDLRESLATLSAPDPFCLCLMPEVAEAMLGGTTPPKETYDLDQLLGPWAAEVCHGLGRRIVYAGRSRVFELPL